MKKMNVLLIAGIVLVIAGAVCIGIFVFGSRNQGKNPGGDETSSAALEIPEISSVSFWRGGSSEGDSYSIDLDGNGNISMSSVPYNGAEETSVKCSVKSEDIYSDIRNIVAGYDMLSWGNLPAGQVEALDAAWETLDIEFADGSYIRVSSNDEFPEGGYGAVKEIHQLLEAQLEQE